MSSQMGILGKYIQLSYRHGTGISAGWDTFISTCLESVPSQPPNPRLSPDSVPSLETPNVHSSLQVPPLTHLHPSRLHMHNFEPRRTPVNWHIPEKDVKNVSTLLIPML
ncbi:uncharacterized protein RCO7_14822 [Rhynchosporium graminicola]|uniref:Uncharacterized protein n=1 Tax=Rhynchosporium graminicola TaxID=2792576 RepID=A0A1E1L4Y6_9HELO|nr:uncharacterized protein RCO7_14822 [Rhynchosporium commune]